MLDIQSGSFLPRVKGRYRKYFELGKHTWFRTKGKADIVFEPQDCEDLSHFLKERPPQTPLHLFGMGSNTLVRDLGVPGVVVRLGAGFRNINLLKNDEIIVGAGVLSRTLAHFCAERNLGGLEFLYGIPGNIGGNLKMNAGAHGKQIQDQLLDVQVLDPQGNLHTLHRDDLGYTYRACALEKNWIFLGGRFRLQPKAPGESFALINELMAQRKKSQPVDQRTGGSTFKNPANHRAWELIDQAGCRGLQKGGAQVSLLHCNFLINHGTATAQELEDLGEEVRHRVKARSGILLEWEIERIGRCTGSEPYVIH